MNQPGIDSFKLIRFLANVSEVGDANMPTPKQADGLPFARIARGI
jgi:hypothetical protein